MKVVDTTPGHRAIQLHPTEQLTSQRLIAALVHNGSHTKAEASDEVSHLFGCVEEQLLVNRAQKPKRV